MLRSVGYPHDSGYTTTIVGLQTGGEYCLAAEQHTDTYLNWNGEQHWSQEGRAMLRK